MVAANLSIMLLADSWDGIPGGPGREWSDLKGQYVSHK